MLDDLTPCVPGFGGHHEGAVRGGGPGEFGFPQVRPYGGQSMWEEPRQEDKLGSDVRRGFASSRTKPT